MNEYSLNFTSDELVKLIEVCNSTILTYKNAIALTPNTTRQDELSQELSKIELLKSKLTSAIISDLQTSGEYGKEEDLMSYVLSIKIGETIYDISYGGIMEVKVTCIEIYKSHIGTYFTIHGTNQYNDGAIYTNKHLRKTLFKTYEEALPHAFSFDKRGNKIPFKSNK